MNYILSKFSAIVLLMFVGSIAFAQDEEKVKPKDVDDFLIVQGQVVDHESILEGVTVRLYKGNLCVDSGYTGKKGVFEFKLGHDLFYGLAFEKFGYEKSLVIIDTHRPNVDPKNEDNGYAVDFEVDLMTEIEGKDKIKLTPEDWDILDFPKVLIVYKEAGEEEGFVSASAYHKGVNASLKKIKDTIKKQPK